MQYKTYSILPLRLATVAAALGLVIVAAPKAPKNIYTIRVPAPIRAEDVQVRYVLAGKFGIAEGWQVDAGDGEVVIRTERAGGAAKSVKGVMYAPGCGFDDIVDEDLSTGPREQSFRCNAPERLTARGRFSRPGEWRNLQVNVEVHYLAPWVRRQLSLDGPVPDFLLTTARVDSTGMFQLTLPNLSQAAQPDRADGGLAMLVREVTSGDILGTLRPPADLAGPFGLKLAAMLPPEIEFQLMPAR